MDYLLVFAHKKEAEAFFANMHFTKVHSLPLELYCHSNFLLFITGMGETQIKKKMAELITSLPLPPLIVNLGFSGSLEQTGTLQDLGNVHSIRSAVRYIDDENTEHIDLDLPETLDFPPKVCITVSDPIMGQEQKEDLFYEADLVDMELFPLAKIARENSCSIYSLKVISDLADGKTSLAEIRKAAPLLSERLWAAFKILISSL